MAGILTKGSPDRTPSIVSASSNEKGGSLADSSKSGPRSLFVDGIRVNVDPDVPALAEGDEEARWTWLDLFKRKKDTQITDWDAIATRPSVFDDPNLAPHYQPMSVLFYYSSVYNLLRHSDVAYEQGRITRTYIV